MEGNSGPSLQVRYGQGRGDCLALEELRWRVLHFTLKGVHAWKHSNG